MLWCVCVCVCVCVSGGAALPAVLHLQRPEVARAAVWWRQPLCGGGGPVGGDVTLAWPKPSARPLHGCHDSHTITTTKLTRAKESSVCVRVCVCVCVAPHTSHTHCSPPHLVM